MKDLYRQLVAGILAAALLAGLTFSTPYVLWFNILISAAIGCGIYFSIPRRREAHEIEVAPGITKDRLDSALSTINEHIVEFERLRDAVNEDGIRKSINAIVLYLNNFSELFKKDAGDLDRIAQHLFPYLAQAHTIVSQYIRLKQFKLEGRQKEKLHKARETIHRIQIGLDDLYQQCLKDDLLELEVNSEVFQELYATELLTENGRERDES